MAYKQQAPRTVFEGGIGATSFTNNAVVLGNGSSAFSPLALGLSNEMLVGSSGADPSWTGSPSMSGSVTAGTGITSTAGTITVSAGNAYGTGISFDSGTNTMSNFTAKTAFTPTLTFGGGSTGITYGTQTGFFTRIGKMVFFNMNIVLTSKGSSAGNMSIQSNTPPAISTTYRGPTNLYFANATWVANADVYVFFLNGASNFNFELRTVNPAGGQITLTDANWSNTTILYVYGFYFMA